MSGEFRPLPVDTPELDADAAGHGGGRRRASAPLSDDSRLAVEIRSLVEQGAMDEARERFGDLVAMHQRRASRIARSQSKTPAMVTAHL